jgi:hypothetical protein
MKEKNSLDFIWRFDPTHEDADHQIFTHVWWDMYCTPGNMYWDEGGTPVTDSNVKAFSDLFYQYIKVWTKGYKGALAGNDILFPFGCDFQFQHAPVSDSFYIDLISLLAHVRQYEQNY